MHPTKFRDEAFTVRHRDLLFKHFAKEHLLTKRLVLMDYDLNTDINVFSTLMNILVMKAQIFSMYTIVSQTF